MFRLSVDCWRFRAFVHANRLPGGDLSFHPTLPRSLPNNSCLELHLAQSSHPLSPVPCAPPPHLQRDELRNGAQCALPLSRLVTQSLMPLETRWTAAKARTDPESSPASLCVSSHHSLSKPDGLAGGPEPQVPVQVAGHVSAAWPNAGLWCGSWSPD